LYRIYPRNYCTNDTITVGFTSTVNNPNLMFMLLPIYYLNGNVNASKEFMHQMLITDFGYGTMSYKSRGNRRTF